MYRQYCIHLLLMRIMELKLVSIVLEECNLSYLKMILQLLRCNSTDANVIWLINCYVMQYSKKCHFWKSSENLHSKFILNPCPNFRRPSILFRITKKGKNPYIDLKRIINCNQQLWHACSQVVPFKSQARVFYNFVSKINIIIT